MDSIKLDDIMVGSRLRKDYGNLDDLDSIADVGLIQPLVLNLIDGRPTLVAGGRRLAKLRDLGVQEVWHGYTCNPERPGFVWRDDELPADVRREIELYENIGRKPMTWKERVISIAQIHKLKLKRAAVNRESWGLRETGAELGMDFSNVSWMVRIAEELANPDSKIHDCSNSTEAIRFFVERKEAEALKALTLLTVPKTQSSTETPVVEINDTGELREELVVPISRMLFHSKMEDYLVSLYDRDQIADHIVTDWPYAIDMANLSQEQGMDVSRVEEEHDVEENLAMYEKWLGAMYSALRDGGYCVIWYDNVHWTYISYHAAKAGFRVQRWPLVWVKTSPCLNQMANKNFTKATEFAIVLSKGNSFLANTQSTNYWSGPRAVSTSNPFAKPAGLWQWIYSAIAVRGQSVLDPFAGEGSSTLAAIDAGLRPIAIESNENHYNQLVSNVREKYTNLTQGNVKFE